MAGKKKIPGYLTMREYAKTVPCSHVAVQKAIKAGVITARAWNGDYIYNKDQADREYLPFFVTTLQQQRKDVPPGLEEWVATGMKIPRGQAGAEPKEIKSVVVVPPVQDERKGQESEAEEVEAEVIDNVPEGQEGSSTWDGGEIPTNAAYPEALRISQILKAQGEQMKNDELAGLLVRKSEINRQLQVAGMEVRKAFERMPARVIDAVRSAKDRSAALLVLEDAIQDVLESMGEVIERALGK